MKARIAQLVQPAPQVGKLDFSNEVRYSNRYLYRFLEDPHVS
jgi:hypothetical protein